MARMPVASGRSIRGRVQACGGWRSSAARSASAGCGLPSTARPEASSTRPSSPSPTRSQRGRLPQPHAVAVADARQIAQGIEQSHFVAEADHLGQQRRARFPLDFRDRPHRRGKAGRGDRHADRLRHAARDGRGHDAIELCDDRNASRPQFLFHAGKLGFEGLVDRAEAGFHAASARRDRGIGDDLRLAESRHLLGPATAPGCPRPDGRPGSAASARQPLPAASCRASRIRVRGISGCRVNSPRMSRLAISAAR